MAPVSDRGGGRSKGRELSLDDCRCPVCLEIFMEPVTLPCTHTFCKECFLETVDKATLCCPMCRKRVSTWARLNSRNNTLVDQQLWTHIQTAFPLQCQRRLSGQDAITEDDPGVSVCFPRVSQPGELKREYEDQVTKLTEEKRAMEEEEQRASEEYIQRLLAEEEELLQEERRRREDDERLARLLSNQLNSNPVSQDNLGPADVTPAKKKKKKDVSGGQMDKFLCPLPSNNSSSSSLSSRCSFVSNKENILVSQVERPLPNLDYYGPQRDRSEPPSVSVDDQLHPGTHRSHMTGDKRKSSELDMTEDEEETVTKRGSLLPPSSSSSLQVEVLQGVSEWEVEQLRRRQQEEDDRRLALLLQKELDQEEKQRATDRRKDSSDPYLLRPNSRGKVEATSSSRTSPASSSKTCSTSPSTRTSTPSSKTSSTSSSPTTPNPSSTSSSRTSSSRGSKQATLTEMFSSLIS
ncbi:E3 ubiquitin-protein ligase rnf168 [Epinephelus moara]|uniref:E3 ubiquitin-protein ligase rnf168 n=1 Tax=Epinephelus moara TaxID=300413 RepID=UPI00214F1FB8|nr:E3 ubiquitin-protein ligase rnf168 [Epinephelus moara]XP_049916608.1 E3 ubiquitin-protein ligase rnf168 [Epinephelus moara]XP_049916612.1 E3 ubiquitin-protein ligase rnf168 [Epinephelus moara]